jgi:transcriptional regulator with XRE-family HTH domain
MYDCGMTDAQVTAGAMLAQLRRRHRLSQAQLAIRAGTSQAAISRVERGLESPTVDRLAALLQVMGETLTLAARPMRRWVDANDLAADHGMGPNERLEQGIALAEFATELATSSARQDAHGR